jgi:hypothetical protein
MRVQTVFDPLAVDETNVWSIRALADDDPNNVAMTVAARAK